MSEHTLESFVANGQAAQKEVDRLVTSAATSSAATKPRALNPTRFLCRSEVRKFLLEFAREVRWQKFERVSEQTLIDINEQVRQLLISRVKRIPSKGKTI